ncbi:unnamed protein product, partial [Aphanomyces euteiches]
ELAAVKSELAKTKHELHIHEKKECELWGALNDERQTFNDLANETRNLESALENMMVENTRQSQLIDQLHVRIHESDKKHKELVLTQEEAHRKWNERQLSTEDQFSRADEQLKLTEKELHDALMASHQLDVQVNSLQKILHRLVEEHDVSTVYPLVWHPDIITSTQENKRSQLLALQSNSEMQKNHNDAVDALKADNEQLKTKNEALSKILEEFEAMCDALHAQVQSHDSTMEETQKIQNDAVDALKADIERLEAKNEALSGMLQDFQSKYDEHQAQEQSHDSTMEEMKKNHNDAVDALKADNEQLKTKNEALSKILEEFEAMCDALHAQVQSHDSTMEEMQKNRNDAMDELDRVRADLEVAQATVKQLQRVHDLVDDINL